MAALGWNERPVSIDIARLRSRTKSLAADNVDGRLDDAAYVARKHELLDEISGLERSARPGIPAARAVEWLKAMSETWEATDVLEAKADLLHAIYDRIVVAGERIVSARLTPEAQAHGIALALPQVVMARPTGVGRAITTYTIPIEGRDEWEAAARAGSQSA